MGWFYKSTLYMLITFHNVFTLAHISNIQGYLPFLMNRINIPIQQQHKILKNKSILVLFIRSEKMGVRKR